MTDAKLLRAAVIVLILNGSSAQAQGHSSSSTPWEIGSTVSALIAAQTVGLGFRFAAPSRGRIAFEAGADWTDLGHSTRLADQMVWFYYAHAKHRLPAVTASNRTRLLLTYGVAGWAERSIDRSGFYTTFVPPFLPSTGLAIERDIAARTVLRGDLQVIWLLGGDMPFSAVRLSTGLSWSIHNGP